MKKIYLIAPLYILITVFSFGVLAKPAQAACSGSVTLYEHDNYEGASLDLPVGNTDLTTKTKSGWGWWSVNWSDEASSIKVPSGCTATLYEHSQQGQLLRRSILEKNFAPKKSVSFVYDSFGNLEGICWR